MKLNRRAFCAALVAAPVAAKLPAPKVARQIIPLRKLYESVQVGPLWLLRSGEALKQLTRFIESPSAPKDAIVFISPRIPYEPEEEWAKRCAVIRSIG